MTDKEILKALECCSRQGCSNEQTADCPLKPYEDCSTRLAVDALKFINHLQAEIERLTDRNKRLGEGVGWLLNNENGIELIRAEAIKEFAEKLKEYVFESDYGGANYEEVVAMEDVNNLVAEMVGEHNEQ